MALAERKILPDTMIRLGMKRLIEERKASIDKLTEEEKKDQVWRFVEAMKSSPIALHTLDANEQHYEVPTEFFQIALGKHLKYSSAYWGTRDKDLSSAEGNMLELVMGRARLGEDMNVLELGCGWGSFCLEASHRFPTSKFTAVSNSRTQQKFIQDSAKKRGIKNLEVVVSDMNDFSTDQKFDRVVSVEMFEHMRNQEKLMRQISSWLNPGGVLFVHIFCHRDFPYLFETEGTKNWMGKYFFTGGMMPSDDLLSLYDSGLRVDRSWVVDGTHYAKTARAWLENIDAKENEVLSILEKTYGREDRKIWFQRWRMFFMACEELFGFEEGREWWVGHYRFQSAREH